MHQQLQGWHQATAWVGKSFGPQRTRGADLCTRKCVQAVPRQPSAPASKASLQPAGASMRHTPKRRAGFWPAYSGARLRTAKPPTATARQTDRGSSPVQSPCRSYAQAAAQPLPSAAPQSRQLSGACQAVLRAALRCTAPSQHHWVWWGKVASSHLPPACSCAGCPSPQPAATLRVAREQSRALHECARAARGRSLGPSPDPEPPSVGDTAGVTSHRCTSQRVNRARAAAPQVRGSIQALPAGTAAVFHSVSPKGHGRLQRPAHAPPGAGGGWPQATSPPERKGEAGYPQRVSLQAGSGLSPSPRPPAGLLEPASRSTVTQCSMRPQRVHNLRSGLAARAPAVKRQATAHSKPASWVVPLAPPQPGPALQAEGLVDARGRQAPACQPQSTPSPPAPLDGARLAG